MRCLKANFYGLGLGLGTYGFGLKGPSLGLGLKGPGLDLGLKGPDFGLGLKGLGLGFDFKGPDLTLGLKGPGLGLKIVAMVTSLTGPLADTLSTLLLACHLVSADFAQFVWRFLVVIMLLHLFHFPLGFFITPICVM